MFETQRKIDKKIAENIAIQLFPKITADSGEWHDSFNNYFIPTFEQSYNQTAELIATVLERKSFTELGRKIAGNSSSPVSQLCYGFEPSIAKPLREKSKDQEKKKNILRSLGHRLGIFLSISTYAFSSIYGSGFASPESRVYQLEENIKAFAEFLKEVGFNTTSIKHRLETGIIALLQADLKKNDRLINTDNLLKSYKINGLFTNQEALIKRFASYF